MAETRTASKKTTTKPKEGPAAPRAEAPKAEAPKAEAAREHVCPVAFCPIGMALSSVQQAGPDVLEHLLAAAREFLLAARTVIDARTSDFDPKKDGGGLERIEIA